MVTCNIPEEVTAWTFPNLDVIACCACEGILGGVFDHCPNRFLMVGEGVDAFALPDVPKLDEGVITASNHMRL